ncbi:MAG: 50S ribosomal protein L9 [Sedimentisphaerales bacterium]|nr:50S ribosomal protein L9 [Sedimentisphaerales bacterium]
MKVLLTSDVKKLGWLGDVVEVADGYARNFLFPQGFAREATDTNIKQIAKEKARRAEERRFEREQLGRAARAVEGAEAVIAAAANEQGHLFGSVFKHEIAENLRSQGFEVPDDVVAIEEHIKQVGTYKINLRFDEDITASVNLVVVPEGADIEAFKAAQKEAEAAKKPQEAAEQQPASPDSKASQGEPEAPPEEKTQQ